VVIELLITDACRFLVVMRGYLALYFVNNTNKCKKSFSCLGIVGLYSILIRQSDKIEI